MSFGRMPSHSLRRVSADIAESDWWLVGISESGSSSGRLAAIGSPTETERKRPERRQTLLGDVKIVVSGCDNRQNPQPARENGSNFCVQN